MSYCVLTAFFHILHTVCDHQRGALTSGYRDQRDSSEFSQNFQSAVGCFCCRQDADSTLVIEQRCLNVFAADCWQHSLQLSQIALEHLNQAMKMFTSEDEDMFLNCFSILFRSVKVGKCSGIIPHILEVRGRALASAGH